MAKPGGKADDAQTEPAPSAGPDFTALLRELARTQKLNGSWNDDVEHTAAALLAFVRHGHTTRAGHFRKPVARALAWLGQSPAQGFPAGLRALALRELAEATQIPEQLTAAKEALRAVPAPATNLEAAIGQVLRRETRAPKTQPRAQSLDDLRLAVVWRVEKIAIAPPLLESELGRALAAGLA